MKVNVTIKNLPKEFDFKSNINPLGLTYHAIEIDYGYVVTTGDSQWVYNREEFHKCFVRKDYVICK